MSGLPENAQDYKDLAQSFVALPEYKSVAQSIKYKFVQTAVSCCLNPYMREIYLISLANGQASILTGYETYIKRAERTGKLDGWGVETSDAGKKACITIYRKDWAHAFKHDVILDECRGYGPLWKKMPTFMLKKVCISQGFRLCFPDELGGMPYTADEMDSSPPADTPPTPAGLQKDKPAEKPAEKQVEKTIEKPDIQEINKRKKIITSYIENYGNFLNEKILNIMDKMPSETVEDLQKIIDRIETYLLKIGKLK